MHKPSSSSTYCQQPIFHCRHIVNTLRVGASSRYSLSLPSLSLACQRPSTHHRHIVDAPRVGPLSILPFFLSSTTIQLCLFIQKKKLILIIVARSRLVFKCFFYILIFLCDQGLLYKFINLTASNFLFINFFYIPMLMYKKKKILWYSSWTTSSNESIRILKFFGIKSNQLRKLGYNPIDSIDRFDIFFEILISIKIKKTFESILPLDYIETPSSIYKPFWNNP